KTLRPRIESTGGKSLSFPDLADRVADDLYKERMTIAAAAEKLPIGNRAELRRWRAAVARVMAEDVDEGAHSRRRIRGADRTPAHRRGTPTVDKDPGRPRHSLVRCHLGRDDRPRLPSAALHRYPG